MRCLFCRILLIPILAGGLVSCATSDSGESSGSSGSNKSYVPGADDSDKPGNLSPAAGTNGAGASMRF